MGKESNLEKNLVQYAKAKGCLTFKFTSPSSKGVPDRVFVHGGACLFLEIKAPGRKPTALQMTMIEKLRAQGVPCWWTDNLRDGRTMLELFTHTNPKAFNEVFGPCPH